MALRVVEKEMGYGGGGGGRGGEEVNEGMGNMEESSRYD